MLLPESFVDWDWKDEYLVEDNQGVHSSSAENLACWSILENQKSFQAILTRRRDK